MHKGSSFLRLTLLALLALCSTGRGEITNSFDIYLADRPMDPHILTEGKGDLSHIHLADSPVISAADIISYDFSNHVLTLKPEVLARIPSGTVQGTPFVVVANGQRIYAGAFVISISSAVVPIPSIIVNRISSVPNWPTNALAIERAYPSAAFGVGPDPRGEPRVKSALTALHKLR